MVSASERCDVIVIGGGSSAFEAAVAARMHGAERVVMLEKAPEAEFGGTRVFSGTGFRFPFEPEEIRELTDMTPEQFAPTRIRPYTNDNFMADLQRVTQGRIDDELSKILVGDANAAVHWSKEVGMRWELQRGVEIDGLLYFQPGIPVHPATLGRGHMAGLSQLLQWRDIALKLDVEIRYESKVTAIDGDEGGVGGVRVLGPEDTYDLAAPATIACSGGFQANPEMRARYLGSNADLLKVRGSRHDTGEVLKMLLALGAKASGHWQAAHATPIDAASPDVEGGGLMFDANGVERDAKRYSYPFTITVNELGLRFFDEGEAETGYTYAKTGWAILRQPGGVAFQLGDRKTRGISTAVAIEAATVRELADLISVDPTVLDHTVTEFNRAISRDVPYDRTKRDGRCTVGLSPDKSNWALEIDEPPFYAYPVTGGITFTFGGVKVDENAQVVSTADRPIKGLFASGDVIGLFFHNYPSMTGQTRNLVFGRRAGAAAAGAIVG